MSTDLIILIELRKPASLACNFANLVRAVASAPIKLGNWQAVDWQGAGSSKRRRIDIVTASSGSEAIASAVENTPTAHKDLYDTPGKLCTGVPWKLGIDSAPLQLSAWSAEFQTMPHPALDGHAELWTTKAGIFLSRGSNPTRLVLVEQYLEQLTQLLLSLIKTLDPASVVVYTGDGMRHPLNAHALWFPNRAAILDCLALIALLWRDGCPAWKLKPLVQPESVNDSWALHEWRTDEQRRTLWQRLADNIEHYTSVSSDTVDRVLSGGKFDFYEAGEGLLLLNYPYFMNGFVDEFFLALLEASSRETQSGTTHS